METATFFASPERSSDEEIAKASRKIAEQALFKKTLDSLPEILLILNKNRQIVYLNENVFSLLGFPPTARACGLRPGELLNCIHLSDAPNGCGTSKFCEACGLVNSILSSQRLHEKSQGECKITIANTIEALDIKVTVNPLELEDEIFSIVTLIDISSEKRRIALERIFFHDVLNLAGGIQGLASVIKMKAPGEAMNLAEAIAAASNSLIDEINAQKQLKLAENGELPVNLNLLNSRKIIQEAAAIYRNHDAAEGKFIKEEPSSCEVQFESDRTILLRILGNMLKNALEATSDGGTVSMKCIENPSSDDIEFRVENASEIPPKAQLQIFQRSFSTKGEGHGLGTYSIKLLGERYLKGKVGFESSQECGTAFFIKLKRNAINIAADEKA